jgi:hypothetical protein
MRKFKIDADGKPAVPWAESATLEDFDSREDFEEYLDEVADSYEEIGAKLRPGEPHPMSYEDQMYSDRYESDMRIFEQTTALEAHKAKHDPTQLPPDQYALYYGSGADRERAEKILADEKFVGEQLQKAAEHRAHGNPVAARDCEQHFIAHEDENIVAYGDEELTAMIDWDSATIEANEARVRGLISGYRKMSDKEHSYVLTKGEGGLKISKIRHPEIPANELRSRMGDFSDSVYLRKLSMHGVQSRDEPKPEPAEAPEPDDDPAKINNSAKGESIVVKGMFG